MTTDPKPATAPPGSLEPDGSVIPGQELANLCSVWRGHAAQCNGDLRLALESCAMDLDRLRDSYAPNH